MPRIPIYQQQQAPNQRASMGRATAAYGDLGLEDLGRSLRKTGAALFRREDDDARLWAHKASADADVAALDYLTKAREAAPPGADGFVESVDGEFNKYREAALKNAPTPRGREYLSAELDRTQATLKQRAMVYQAGERVRYRGQLLGEATDSAAKIVYANPDDFDHQIGKQLFNIRATEGIDPETRSKQEGYARRQLAWFTTLSRIDQNPEAWKGEGSAWNMLDAKEQQSMRDYAEGKVRALEVERRQREAEARAQQAERREILRQRVTDQTAMAYDGRTVPNPITRTEFEAAGIGEDYDAYQDTLQMGPDFASLAGMSGQQMVKFLAARKPEAEEGYARETKQHDALQAAAVGILKERNADPIAFASSRGLATFGALDPSREDFGAELRKRAAVSAGMQKDYGTPRQLLTKDEAAGMAQMLNGMTAVETTGLLQQLRRASPDKESFTALMGQLRPDSPVTTLAGAMLAEESTVRTADGGMFSKPSGMASTEIAQRILQGEDLLNPTKASKAQDGKPKLAMPEESQLRGVWAAYTGDAYRGAPEAHDTAYQGYRAFYAATVARLGQYDGALNSEVAEAAARAVSGGVMDVGGKKIVLPFGVDEDIAREQLEKAWKAASANRNDHIALDTIQLQTVANGVYLVTAGAGPLRDGDGKLIHLRIGGGQ